jgi:cell division protein FtsB
VSLVEEFFSMKKLTLIAIASLSLLGTAAVAQDEKQETVRRKRADKKQESSESTAAREARGQKRERATVRKQAPTSKDESNTPAKKQ